MNLESKSALSIFLTVVIGVSLIGFLAGTRSDEYALSGAESEAKETASTAPDAPTYTSLRTQGKAAGSGWEAELDALRAAGPQVLDAVSLEGTHKAEALAQRKALRAYDGAPPQIPHAIRQDSASECLSCHEEGLRFRGLLAPPMSHTAQSLCTQCHVVAQTPLPGGSDLPADPRDVENTFAGLDSPSQGERAWEIAPPQIPHRVFMRELCDSCHGVNGRDPIRSTHPFRLSCEQCHAASAAVDLRPGVE